MSTTTFDALGSQEQLRIAWAFMWRGLIMTLCSLVAGFIAGFILGFIAAIVARSLGYDVTGLGFRHVAQTLGGAAGLVIALVITWQYIRWLFRSRLGGFRLTLVRENAGAAV